MPFLPSLKLPYMRTLRWSTLEKPCEAAPTNLPGDASRWNCYPRCPLLLLTLQQHVSTAILLIA